MPKKSRRPKHEPAEASFAGLGEVLAALSHPTRRTIVLTLAVRGPVTAGDLADRFRVAWPTVTRHLGVLQTSGVLRVAVEGRNRVYSLNAKSLETVSRWIEEVRAMNSTPRESAAWRRLGYAKMPGSRPLPD